MTIGILGRHESLLATAITTAERLGHVARGTTRDGEALDWIREGTIQAIVIGGGVDATSRQTVLAACTVHGVRAVEVCGPGHLAQALAAL